jgi:hypothetical protein
LQTKTGKKEEENGEKRGHYKSFQKSKKLSNFFYFFHDQLSPTLLLSILEDHYPRGWDILTIEEGGMDILFILSFSHNYQRFIHVALPLTQIILFSLIITLGNIHKSNTINHPTSSFHLLKA